jgi:cellulose synthase/poly-beta-1,6-N-acetylglucosamine synthase-like glycosyltransferase
VRVQEPPVGRVSIRPPGALIAALVDAHDRPPQKLSVHTNLLIGIVPLILLFCTLGALLCLMAYPLFRRYPDDRGDGNSVVLIAPPKLPPVWRAPVFVVLFTSLVIVIQGVQGAHNPTQLYVNAVTRITEHVVRAPAELNGYLTDLVVGLRFLVAGAIVCLAIMGRGSFERRLLICLSAVWFLAVMIVADSVLSVINVVTGAPIGPGTLLGTFVVIGLGYLAMTRTILANYCLPRPSALSFVPRPRLQDNLTLILLTVVAAAICSVSVLFIYHLSDPHLKPLLPVLLPVPFAEGTIVLRTLGLAAMGWLASPKEPPAGDVRIPIDVIIPAYNEESVIVPTLQAVDAAAGRHGGVVTVFLCDDGSTDRTRELVQQTMDGFRFAQGRIIEGRHGGKSAALNTVLTETTTDIVIRIDADTLVDEWCLYHVQRWFDDPAIGLIEALMWPRFQGNRSVFPRFRLFEELRQFGMNHRTIELVDGVNVVPGVFTAFRREVAIRLNGFTVGMNGEDGDFTLRFSRLGYRTHLDPKIIVYEDVPRSYMEIREQRIRWTRGMIHNHSRHGPYRAGFATPKVWFTQAHLFYAKTFRPLRLMFFFYLLVIAIFEGTYQSAILVFLTAYVVAMIAFSIIGAALALGYRFTRYVLWSFTWPLWAFCTNVFSVESWLSLPGRPVGLVTSPSNELVAATPVIH